MTAIEPGVHNMVIQVQDFEFAPQTVLVHPGDTVTWVLAGGIHGVRADNGSFIMAPSDSWTEYSHTFDKPGKYRYYCQLHGATGSRGMSGVVIVQ